MEQKEVMTVCCADGINSKVRKHGIWNYEAKYVGSSVWRYPLNALPNWRQAICSLEKNKSGFDPDDGRHMYMFIVAAEGMIIHLFQKKNC
jgi:hypothetical protein